MQIKQILDEIYPLPENSFSILNEYIKEISLPKNHVLLRADRVESKIYFIKKGIVRAYAEFPDNEVTFWFGSECETVISMKSYVANEKGYETIETLEECILYELDSEKLKELFQKDIHIANWGRKFAEKELVKTEERLISKLFKTATERYKELIQNHPQLIQRVQLSHIASYLGITQVSLSRIRASKF